MGELLTFPTETHQAIIERELVLAAVRLYEYMECGSACIPIAGTCPQLYIVIASSSDLKSLAEDLPLY